MGESNNSENKGLSSQNQKRAVVNCWEAHCAAEGLLRFKGGYSGRTLDLLVSGITNNELRYLAEDVARDSVQISLDVQEDSSGNVLLSFKNNDCFSQCYTVHDRFRHRAFHIANKLGKISEGTLEEHKEIWHEASKDMYGYQMGSVLGLIHQLAMEAKLSYLLSAFSFIAHGSPAVSHTRYVPNHKELYDSCRPFFFEMQNEAKTYTEQSLWNEDLSKINPHFKTFCRIAEKFFDSAAAKKIYSKISECESRRDAPIYCEWSSAMNAMLESYAVASDIKRYQETAEQIFSRNFFGADSKKEKLVDKLRVIFAKSEFLDIFEKPIVVSKEFVQKELPGAVETGYSVKTVKSSET